MGSPTVSKGFSDHSPLTSPAKSPSHSPRLSYSQPGPSSPLPLIPPLLRPIASHPLVHPTLERLFALASHLPRPPGLLGRSRVVYLVVFAVLVALSTVSTPQLGWRTQPKLRNLRARPVEPAFAPSTVGQYCPRSSLWSGEHVPTVILKASHKLKGANLQRTTHLNGSHALHATDAFLAYDHPTLSFGSSSETPAQLRDGSAVKDGDQLCGLHRIPTGPVVPPRGRGWSDGFMTIGVATTGKRGLYHLPLWRTWLPHKADSTAVNPDSKADTRPNPMLMVLAPAATNDEERAQLEQLREEGQRAGMFLDVAEYSSVDRFEKRYFALAQEMHRAAVAREARGGFWQQWFMFIDDDTFFPDWNTLGARLAQYSSREETIIGAVSEAHQSLDEFGYFAYGGAGMIVSRAVLDKMNAPGVWDACLAQWGDLFGGDQMVSKCAERATGKPIDWLLRTDPSLHQMDLVEDASGWFQSAFLITTIHHWDSWTRVFPKWVMKKIGKEGELGDERRDSTLLLGRAAKAVGGDNFARRYLFERDRVAVHLGYSVVLYAEPVKQADLGRSEHTWDGWLTLHPTRPALHEGTEKKSYFLTAVREIDPRGVWRLEHSAADGERIDIIYDRKERFREPPSGWIW